MVKREKYLERLIKVKDNGFPKVITGLRRCGKPYLLTEIYKNYLHSIGIDDDHILILELDDDRNYSYRDPVILETYVREYCAGKDRVYVFVNCHTHAELAHSFGCGF